MERSRRGALAIWHQGPATHLSWLVLAAAIAQLGCHSYCLPSQQFPASEQASYTAFLPVSEPLVQHPDPQSGAKSVDRYYQSTLQAWRQIEVGGFSCSSPANWAAMKAYHENLTRLLEDAARYGRLDPRGRLLVTDAGGLRAIPIAYYGFAWKRGDFCQVLPAGEIGTRDLLHHYYSPGLGAALVAVRQACGEEPFFPPRQPFAATAVLRPTPSDAVLEFYNPLVLGATAIGPAQVGLDRDLTASLAYAKQQAPHKYLQGFLDPGDTDVQPKLIMMEPYQAGKIPVVFIHGLGSDPLTWADAINGLGAQPDIYARYQFWLLYYPTGGAVLESAAALREQLVAVREIHDPRHRDPAFEQIVLVGHSLGGLVAQLQVTYSYDILWQRAANQPIEAVRTTPQMREQLRRSFYFDPSPLVKRVVFIGTPHRGSNLARRLVGRVASKLVQFSAAEDRDYRQLMENNRDIFAPYLWRSRPTSIDLLEPSNPLLEAMGQMPYGRCVRVHSIIGTSAKSLNGEISDGVVPVSSARLAGSCSELAVPIRHEDLNKKDPSVAELRRILREHAASAP